MRDQKIIKFQNKKFYFHLIYKKYAASKDGQVYSNKHKIIIKQNLKKGGGGYLYFNAYNETGRKAYSISRFVYECFNGIIEDDKEVDHIDNNKINNKISNLQLLTHEENVRKSNCKSVKSFNIETREEKKFSSIKEASEEIGISSTSICLICKKKTKIAKSKKDGMIYVFSYI